MASIFRDQEVSELIKRLLNQELIAAAEPIIQKAVAEFEKEVRKKLAVRLVGMVDESYSMEQHGRTLTIRVQMPER